MRSEELSQHLVQLGMAADAAAAYVHLCRVGPTTASVVAASLRISRPRAYRSLEQLANQGFVTAGVGRPRLFMPVAPNLLFNALRLQARETLQRIEQAEADLLPSLETLRGASVPAPRPHFTVVRGLEAVTGHARQVLDLAERRFDVLLGHGGARPLLQAFAAAGLLRQPAGKLGVRVLVGDTAGVPQRSNLPVRQLVGSEAPTLVLADGRECLTVLAENAQQQPESAVGFRTNAAGYVAGQQALFDHYWSVAEAPKGGARKPPL